MDPCARRLRAVVAGLVLAAGVLLPGLVPVRAGNPHGAYYDPSTDRVFWFIHVSDPHIGARGSTDADRLRWIVTTGRSTINPEFIVATGDLTDSTNGNLFGWPNGPYQAEWDEYKAILAAAGADASVFYDIPGNHDAYNDKTFAYYRANSVQGRATGQTQLSWTRTFSFGTYHFLGVDTADNTGDPFSLSWPWGDYAGLDTDELAFINQELANHANADLTLVFGHHPVTDTGASDDTWLYYGHQEFIQALDFYHASLYGYGHTHRYSQALFTGDAYTGFMVGDGIHYDNVASLGKSSGDNYSVVAIDCNGLSSVTQAVGTWPVVLITAPVDARVGGAANPYAYPVPAAPANPIRALIFDTAAVSQVSYRVDGAATWYPMNRVTGSPALWQASWDASSLSPGSHTLEVRAEGTTARSHAITVAVEAGVNHPPVAVDDAYDTPQDTTLVVAAPGVLGNDSDPDGNPLTADLGDEPAHGTVVLHADGSFSYTPAVGFSGLDSFTYMAHDGTTASSAAVALTVSKTEPADTVTIKTATYAARRHRLSVVATSDAQPAAELTVVGYGTMKYSSKTRTYSLQVSVTPAPSSVTVTSSLGGSATRTVSVR